MNVELITTGSELMLGFVLNTHQQWLCRELANLGYAVIRQVAVSDASSDIRQAIAEALPRTRIIITTGGLGPTSDDRTRDVIAEMLGRRLTEDPAVLRHIQTFFTTRNRPMPVTTRVQAMVPEGARVLENRHGTAPGLVLQHGNGVLIMLPGPPRELRPMFTDQVAPLLLKELPPVADFACRTLRSTGLGESLVEERISRLLTPLVQAGLEIGYCARVGEVDVRLAARGPTAATLVQEAENLVSRLLSEYIYGAEPETLESVVVRLLTEKKQTLTLAESCTGGFIAHRVTNVPGASGVLLAGLVTYSNEAKQTFLGVRAETLATHGAVSEPVAREMAEGARTRTAATFALSVTGIAGPSGGTPEKPVGTVFVGLSTGSKTVVKKLLNRYDRDTFKFVTSQQALDLLRRTSLES